MTRQEIEIGIEIERSKINRLVYPITLGCTTLNTASIVKSQQRIQELTAQLAQLD